MKILSHQYRALCPDFFRAMPEPYEDTHHWTIHPMMWPASKLHYRRNVEDSLKISHYPIKLTVALEIKSRLCDVCVIRKSHTLKQKYLGGADKVLTISCRMTARNARDLLKRTTLDLLSLKTGMFKRFYIYKGLRQIALVCPP